MADRVTQAGPAAGEPPLHVDPRRWGSVVGLAGGMTFIASNAAALGTAGALVAWATGLSLVVTALLAHYVWPVPLGPLVEPRRFASVTYVVCVVGELALLGAGSHVLADTNHSQLRPALIAVVVGLHFLPLGWAFHQPIFLVLGGAVTATGLLGLVTGGLGVTHAAEVAAVIAGFLMLVLLLLHAQGRLPHA